MAAQRGGGDSDDGAHGGDEQQSIAMALAAAQHHSAPKSAGPVSHNVLWIQNTARDGTEFCAMSEDSDAVGGGGGAAAGQVPLHSVEQIIENFVPVQILDGPVPQFSMGGCKTKSCSEPQSWSVRRSCW